MDGANTTVLYKRMETLEVPKICLMFFVLTPGDPSNGPERSVRTEGASRDALHFIRLF